MDYPEIKEIFADVLPIIFKAAPIIGSYIGTPTTGIILSLFGAIVQSNPCDHCSLAKKLKEDADLYAKLAQLEATHAEWIKKAS